MPTNTNFAIPFLGGGPQISEQIMQGLTEGFNEHIANQQLGLKKQELAQQASHQAILDKFTQTEIDANNMKMAFDKETDPVRKQALYVGLVKTAFDNALTEKQLQQFGVDTDAIKANLPHAPGGASPVAVPGAATPGTPSAMPVPGGPTPFQKEIGITRGFLEKDSPLTPGEEAIWGTAVNAANATLNSKPITDAVKEIFDKRQQRVEFQQKEGDTQAQRETANAIREQTAAIQAEGREERKALKAQEPVYALNKETGQREQTTQGEVSANPDKYSNPVAVKESDLNRDASLSRQLGDAQMNLSRYKVALSKMDALSVSEKRAVAALVGEDKFKSEFMGVSIPSDWLNKLLTSENWQQLNPKAQDAVAAYIGTRGAVIAYQKAVSGSGRSNKEQLEIELQNIPNPILPVNVRNMQLSRFQENIDQAGTGLPKLVGVPSPQDIRSKIEQPSKVPGTTVNPFAGIDIKKLLPTGAPNPFDRFDPSKLK